MMYSVVDVAGLNRISRRVFANDQGIRRSAGESVDFLIGGGDGHAVIELQAQEAGIPRFKDFFQSPGCLDAERAVDC